MRRACVLLVLMIGGAVSMLIAAPGNQGRPTPPLSLEKLKDNLYILHGGCMCGNTTFYITDAGVVMVDTKVAGKGPEILEQLRTVTDMPIAMIINTHTHFDHTGSNAEFGAVDRIVTHENAKASLMKESCEMVTNCDAFKGENAKFLPNTTFKSKTTLTLGQDQIDLHYFGPGHTDGDAWIVFPDIRIAVGGDLFGAKGLPYIDTANGGTALGYADTVANAAAGLKNIVDTVISGHVDAYPVDDLVRYAEFHKGVKAHVFAGIKAGKFPEEVSSEYSVPADLQDFSYAEPFAGNFVKLMFAESMAK